MNTIRNTGSVSALCLGLVLSGCATTHQSARSVSDDQRATASQAEDRPNPAGRFALECTGGSLQMLRAGAIGVPISIALIGLCLPAAVGVGVIYAIAPNAGSGSSGVLDTGPAALRKLDDAERSPFPQSTPAGCSDCYAYQGAHTGPAEMRRLTAAERWVFPDSSPAGCSDCYAHRVVDTGPVEMRKLSRVESSVFPKPSPGCTYGYGC